LRGKPETRKKKKREGGDEGRKRRCVWLGSLGKRKKKGKLAGRQQNQPLEEEKMRRQTGLAAKRADQREGQAGVTHPGDYVGEGREEKIERIIISVLRGNRLRKQTG